MGKEEEDVEGSRSLFKGLWGGIFGVFFELFFLVFAECPAKAKL